MDNTKAAEANKKLKKMFDDEKDNFKILFLGLSELEEKFETFKPKKASKEEYETFEHFRDA